MSWKATSFESLITPALRAMVRWVPDGGGQWGWLIEPKGGLVGSVGCSTRGYGSPEEAQEACVAWARENLVMKPD